MSYWYGGYPAYGPYGSYGNINLWGAYVTYGSLQLTDASPPQSFTEPISLAEAKDFLKVPERSPAEPAEDTLIQSLIIAARSYAEREQGRDLVLKQWDLRFDYWMNYRIELPPVPLVSVDLVEYTDFQGNVTTMTEGTDYLVDMHKEPGAIVAPYNTMWPSFTPWPTSSILIRFRSGYAADHVYWQGDGQAVKSGMRYLVSNGYNLRLPAGSSATEWPFTATAGLSFGARQRVY